MEQITTVRGLNILEINDKPIPTNIPIYLRKQNGKMVELGTLEELLSNPKFLGTSTLYDKYGTVHGCFILNKDLKNNLFIFNKKNMQKKMENEKINKTRTFE